MRKRCAAAVDVLVRRHGWRLCSRDDLIRRAQARLQQRRASDTVHAVTWMYSEVLYAACSGIEGAARREQGFRELHRWLYTIAYQRYRDVAADATQQALERTHTGIGQCRESGMFLMVALTHLYAAACQLRRQFMGTDR